MYRYKVRAGGVYFNYREEVRPLRKGDIIKREQGPDEYRVMRIEKEPRAVFGITPPLPFSRGIARAERYLRSM